MIDWNLAARIGANVGGDPSHRPRPALAERAAEGERLVATYTGLHAPAPLPAPELLDRPSWVEANIRSVRPLMDPLTDRLGDGLGPLGRTVRGGAELLVAAEVGLMFGYVSRRVLGQYEVVLLDAEAPPRLLFVGPNLEDAARQLQADDDDLETWVALHEVTHALQFAGVPWLRDHLAELLRSLISALDVSVDPARLLRLPSREDVRALIDAVAAGELISLVAGPQQRELLDRIQATMAVLEGYAEHVMDAVGAELLPSLPRLRAAMDRRRSTQSGPSRLLARLLGLEMKLRQYQIGKRFCDQVVEREGIEGLNRVWASPGALPSLAELESPAKWMDRTRVPSVTK